MDIKNVGIMTFHWAANYGAVLQAWALQEYLESVGINAELIDYVPLGYRASLKKCLKTKRPSRMLVNYKEYKKEKKLEIFRKKNLNRSSVHYDYKDQLINSPPPYDCYISGSDQIWNPYFTMNGQRGITLPYFLNFAPQNAIRIAFSSSFGLSHIPEEMKNSILPELEKYKAISVREKTGVAILDAMGIESTLTSDPTLLLNAQSYRKLFDKSERKKQLFFYCLHGHRRNAISIARKYAYSIGLELIEDECKGIEEWLQQISSAEFVITNSFHGVVFCLLFHTPFIAFEKESKKMNMSSRLTTLLDVVGLGERFCKINELSERINNQKGIDWENTDKIIAQLRKKSQEYLNEQLNVTTVKTIEQINKRKCMGCGLCKEVCPTKSITMIEDTEGFWIPTINKSKCIHCGLCYNECIAQTPPAPHHCSIDAYSCFHKNCDIRTNSSSGGAFTALSQTFISKGGKIAGAAYIGDLQLQHIVIDCEDDLARIRGSKYMASRAWEAYSEVKYLLEQGERVLFSGTPCQIAAIKKYTNNHPNLFCVDVACHGIPSNSVLQAHCNYITQKTGHSISQINFRDKITGWKRYSITYENNIEKIYSEKVDESYFSRAYLSNLILRSSCYDCIFACKQRQGDITLCDHWFLVQRGIDKEDKGISGVLVNSDKGLKLINEARDRLVIAKVEVDEILSGNPVLRQSLGKCTSRSEFFHLMDKQGYRAAIKKYCSPPSLIKKICNKIKLYLGR